MALCETSWHHHAWCASRVPCVPRILSVHAAGQCQSPPAHRVFRCPRLRACFSFSIPMRCSHLWRPARCVFADGSPFEALSDTRIAGWIERMTTGLLVSCQRAGSSTRLLSETGSNGRFTCVPLHCGRRMWMTRCSRAAPRCCGCASDARWSTPVSTRILGRRTAPFPPVLIPHRVPHGFTPRS